MKQPGPVAFLRKLRVGWQQINCGCQALASLRGQFQGQRAACASFCRRGCSRDAVADPLRHLRCSGTRAVRSVRRCVAVCRLVARLQTMRFAVWACAMRYVQPRDACSHRPHAPAIRRMRERRAVRRRHRKARTRIQGPGRAAPFGGHGRSDGTCRAARLAFRRRHLRAGDAGGVALPGV